ncbi:MAG: sigma-70 family RNA polymerase sigma factor [Acidobacteriaceae bacterium]|nr:sigma-70 family RNA polymerase sigma factor [Acidobacteriaceae bacterium]
MSGNPAAGGQLTVLLQAWRGGNKSALEQLTPIVYGQLHRLAYTSMFAEKPGHVLQPSALVNEAFLRLMSGAPVDWKDRAHFFGFAARIMRQILVDFARENIAAKRGSGVPHVELEMAQNEPTRMGQYDFLDINRALEELSALEPRQAEVVELKYFGGLENGEIAELIGVSENTVLRDWRTARAWLFYRLRNQFGEASQ